MYANTLSEVCCGVSLNSFMHIEKKTGEKYQLRFQSYIIFSEILNYIYTSYFFLYKRYVSVMLFFLNFKKCYCNKFQLYDLKTFFFFSKL